MKVIWSPLRSLSAKKYKPHEHTNIYIFIAVRPKFVNVHVHLNAKIHQVDRKEVKDEILTREKCVITWAVIELPSVSFLILVHFVRLQNNDKKPFININNSNWHYLNSLTSDYVPGTIQHFTYIFYSYDASNEAMR